ncbi:MAG: cobalt ECF transporter T component CbiQ [Methanobacterium sp.]|uniref:cobalt ECF transporter T component CbiQ n=1 Tax=Methanobacterium sp. TaxID=2164 RepID=UPI003C78AE44
MSAEGQLYKLEKETMKESVLHSLDGRVKLIVLILIIIYAVYTTNIYILGLLEIYLVTLILVSNLSLKTSALKILLIIPFGASIAVLQPFVHAGTIIYTLPLGIHVTSQGVMFMVLLLSRLVVSLTCVVLLSSWSSMQEVAESFRKLGLPRDFSMVFSLFIRFLFMFYDELQRIRNAQTTRNFDIFNQKIDYMWRLRQVAYTVAMMFLRSYERGESVYLSMLSRGYSDNSELYSDRNKKIGKSEYYFISTTFLIIICLQILVVFFLPKTVYLGVPTL